MTIEKAGDLQRATDLMQVCVDFEREIAIRMQKKMLIVWKMFVPNRETSEYIWIQNKGPLMSPSFQAGHALLIGTGADLPFTIDDATRRGHGPGHPGLSPGGQAARRRIGDCGTLSVDGEREGGVAQECYEKLVC